MTEAVFQDDAPTVNGGPATMPVHPSRLSIEPDGVVGFEWPLPFAEIEGVRDRFLTALYAWIRERDPNRDRDAELIWLNGPQIAVEVMRLFNGFALLHRFDLADRPEAARDSGSSLIQSLVADGVPARSRVLKATLRGQPKDSAWRQAARFAKHGLTAGPVAYRPKPLIDSVRHILTFSDSPMIRAHAAALNRRVALSRVTDWMDVTDTAALDPALGASAGAMAEVIGLAEAAIGDTRESLPEAFSSALQSFLTTMTARAHGCLRDLEAQPDRLPKVFWSGSSGIIFNRVMSRAVGKAGGETVGHDHGTGTGWWDTAYQTVFEFNYVDRFITYRPAMAEGLKRSLRHDLLARPKHQPSIESLPAQTPTGPKPAPRATPGPSRAKQKRIMYVPTAYVGDDMYLLPLLADAVTVDWQCRLFAYLRDAGHEILVKPHPESICSMPAAFTERFGARVLDGPFESVMDQADLLLFDYLQTSCIVSGLRSNRAMVLIEFPRLTLDPQARALLAKRTALVPGRFDADNRALVDPNDLTAAIQLAPELSDNSFCDAYYGNLA